VDICLEIADRVMNGRPFVLTTLQMSDGEPQRRKIPVTTENHSPFAELRNSKLPSIQNPSLDPVITKPSARAGGLPQGLVLPRPEEVGDVLEDEIPRPGRDKSIDVPTP
jgi:hypothetical protein